MTRAFAVILNALGLYAIALVLAAAFAAQLLLHELPCPLCLLQRVQFALLAIGPILNVRGGRAPVIMPCRCWLLPSARRFRYVRSCCKSDPETPATARRCSVTIIIRGR